MSTRYFEALRAAGHVLQTVEDEPDHVDQFALSYEFHNGPVCVLCRDSWCVHCNDRIEPCRNAAIEGQAVNITEQHALPSPD